MARVQVSISIARQDVYDRTVLPAKNTGDLNKLISTLLTVYTDFQEVRQLVDGASLGEKRRQQGEIQDLFSKMRETLEVQAEELNDTTPTNHAFADALDAGGGTGASGGGGAGPGDSGTETPEVMDMLQKILSKVEGLYEAGGVEGASPTGKSGFVGYTEEELEGKSTPEEESNTGDEEFTLGDSVNIEGEEPSKEETPAEEETADEDLSESFLNSLMDSVGL